MKRLFVVFTLTYLALITPRLFAAEPWLERTQPAQIDTSQLDLKEFALSISKGATTDYERAERMLDWLSHNSKWLATDYKQRTVKEIIDRQGGNCFELASV
jgi:transglutaminase-like putative cysteine protease